MHEQFQSEMMKGRYLLADLIADETKVLKRTLKKYVV